MDMLDRLNRIQREIEDRDPLLQAGIGKDWVCVVSPAAVANIIEAAKQQSFYNPSQPQHLQLQMVTRRKTWIIPDAKEMVQYMTKETMVVKFGDYFLRNMEDKPTGNSA